MLNSYLELNFDVLHATTKNRYAVNNVIKLVILGPLALFRNYTLTTCSGKHLEEVNHAHIASLLYKILTSARGCDDLFIGFGRRHDRRQRGLTN